MTDQLAELLSATERLGGMGSWEWRPADDRVLWSDNLFRIYGYEPGEIQPTLDAVMERTHPQDRAALEERLSRDRNGADVGASLDFRILRPDGTVRWLEATVAIVAEGAVKRMIGLVADRTEQRRAEQEVALHLAVERATRAWTSLDADGAELLSGVAGALGFTRGVIWVPADGSLRARATWQDPATARPGVEREIAELVLPMGVGIGGEAWELRRPVVVADASAKSAYSFRAAASQDGLRGAIAIPALHEGEVLAVVGLAGPEYFEAAGSLRDSLVKIGHEIGELFSRHRVDVVPLLLTARETQILQLAAESYSGPAIAAELSIAPSTVKTHLLRIYGKLGVDDRAAAVAAGLRRGLIR